MQDDEAAKPVAHFILGQDLALLSVAELERAITLLQDEITRLEAQIAEKLASRDAADAFFKR